MMSLSDADKANHPQTAFTQPRARIAYECAELLFKACTRAKKMELAGECNDLLLFLDAAYRAAPDKLKQ